MRDAWKAKTLALYGMLRKAGPVAFSLDAIRDWLEGHATNGAWRCAYCRALMPLDEVSIDHEIPVKMGGPNALSNFAVCCKSCNGAKGTMTNWTFIKIMAVLDHCGPQERADVLGRLRSGQWRTARARGYQRRRRAA